MLNYIIQIVLNGRNVEVQAGSFFEAETVYSDLKKCHAVVHLYSPAGFQLH